MDGHAAEFKGVGHLANYDLEWKQLGLSPCGEDRRTRSIMVFNKVRYSGPKPTWRVVLDRDALERYWRRVFGA